MNSTSGLSSSEPSTGGVNTEGYVSTTKLGNTPPIASRKPGRILDILQRLERFLPDTLNPAKGFYLSFKNRILTSTLLVLIGVVIIIGITLQIAVFPSLKGDYVAIVHLKIIHFLASVAVILVSWLFIERISKRITLPLLELTKRADQISREAGERMSDEPIPGDVLSGHRQSMQTEDPIPGDEIEQLTSSFNRMLVHLKASEASLRESEEKYRFLFDNSPSPTFVIDADNMMILDVNARAGEEYQYTVREFLGMSFADLGLDRDRAQTSAHLKQVFPTEATLLPILHHRRKDGSLFMVTFLARLCRYCNAPAIIAAVWDVTERLEKHAMLIQAGKMATLGEMATGVAHELNQPLNVIRLGCDFLEKKFKSGRPLEAPEINQVTAELTTSVERASRIINHLRQFGRKAEDAMTPIDINVPVLNVFTLMGTQLEARGIRWSLSLAEGLPRVLGDANRLEQVFINLVLNARDAILTRDRADRKEGRTSEKKIAIKSLMENDRLVVIVSDTGPGIPQSLRSKVFEPFFTTKKIGEGTGLGLSISYSIIKEHNGTIEIDPDRADGTTFRLTFPVLASGDQR